MQKNQDWKSYYQSHLTAPLEALKKELTEGCNVVAGHAVATPDTTLKGMMEHVAELSAGNIFHVLYYGAGYQFTLEIAKNSNLKINFLESSARKACRADLVGFFPCHFHEVPDLFTDDFHPADVAIMRLIRPNEEGYCSFSLSCNYTKPTVDTARVVIAEVNGQLPFIGGDNLVHVTKLDHIIEVNTAAPEMPPAVPGKIERKIGEICASMVEDGNTLQLGTGAIPDAVLSDLKDRKDLGIHSEMIIDGVMKLMREGVIMGKRKTRSPNKVVTAFAMGTKELCDFFDHNEDVEIYPVSYTNDPFVVASIDNMISINSCLEIDLLGQVNAESIGYSMLDGSSGQVDFMCGVRRSKGGHSILALASTARGGEISRIVPILAEGAAITTGRSDVDYVITKYGMARLRGKTARERAEALIGIAHPKFKEMLRGAVVQRWGEQSELTDYHMRVSPSSDTDTVAQGRLAQLTDKTREPYRMNVRIEPSWHRVLEEEFEKFCFKTLTSLVCSEYQTKKIYPPGRQIFRAFDLCPFEDVRVVIPGQDPYHGVGQAEGLTFSIPEGVEAPPSLHNILTEIPSDLGHPSQIVGGHLTPWCRQGVLLLNATLTVVVHEAGSHQGRRWETFTDQVISFLSSQREHLVSMLWGNYARCKRALTDRQKHLILEAPHPSPPPTHRGFFGCRHSSKANAYLQRYDYEPIRW